MWKVQNPYFLSFSRNWSSCSHTRWTVYCRSSPFRSNWAVQCPYVISIPTFCEVSLRCALSTTNSRWLDAICSYQQVAVSLGVKAVPRHFLCLSCTIDQSYHQLFSILFSDLKHWEIFSFLGARFVSSMSQTVWLLWNYVWYKLSDRCTFLSW